MSYENQKLWKERLYMYLSPSSINLYLQCPYAYFLSYIKKIKLNDDQYSLFGKSIHKILEMYYKEFNGDLQSSIEKYWDMNIPEEMSDIANVCFKNFLENKYDFPLYLEEHIENEKYGINCYVDRINNREIIDYKTGTNVSKDKNLIQGMVYYLVVKEKYNLNIEKIDFLYLKKGKVYTIYPTNDNIELINSTIKKVRNSINDNEFPKTGKCNSCYYNIICRTQEKFIQKTLCI